MNGVLKTFYIHGLDSSPIPEKMEILRRIGLVVTAPHLDYRNQPDAYQILKNTAIGVKAEFLIGSSLGGYMAFWLAEDLGLPCLLFNPAMPYDDQLHKNIPELSNLYCPARFVVIGAHDETVDPVKNLEFFRNIDRKDCHQRVIVCEWLGHQTDLVTFEEMVQWGLSGYRICCKK